MSILKYDKILDKERERDDIGYTGNLYDSGGNLIATVINGLIKTVIYVFSPSSSISTSPSTSLSSSISLSESSSLSSSISDSLSFSNSPSKSISSSISSSPSPTGGDTYNILTEALDLLITEGGDNLVYQ